MEVGSSWIPTIMTFGHASSLALSVTLFRGFLLSIVPYGQSDARLVLVSIQQRGTPRHWTVDEILPTVALQYVGVRTVLSDFRRVYCKQEPAW